MRRVHLVFGLLVAWIVVDQARIFLFGGADLGVLFAQGSRNAPMLLAALLCLWRAVGARAERGAWILIGLGVAAWSLGDVYYSTVLWDLESVPTPSPADAGYLLFPPLLIAGVVMLGRARTGRFGPALLADGAGAALAVAALCAALVLAPVQDAAEGRALEIATLIAYPVTDLVVVAVVVGVLASRGWLMDRTWAFLAAGVAVFWIADSMYLIQAINDAVDAEAWYAPGWTLGMVLFGWAAWQPGHTGEASRERLRAIVMPLAFAALALGVLVAGSFTSISVPAVVLSGVALAALGVRLTITFRENVSMLHASREEALTDALTGLGNRRALGRAVDVALDATPDDGRQWVLALFDLDGFKHYNDTFGHPAGDALLQRLGVNLATFVDGEGEAFRMGGDEFCALLRAQPGAAEVVVARAAIALSDHGEGFEISCSHGAVLLPGEAGSAAEALRIADQRMYAHKRSGRSSASRQSADVLLAALAERNPALGDHIAGVTELARATADALGVSDGDLDAVVHAAELHDVGKVAIPDRILNKPGPLDDAEWAFIRQHTLVGERIAAAAPSLAPVGRLVRSSHERWDGGGYPDALAGEAIPLGSRIIAVCDAFEAMTAERPYSRPMSVAAALAELRRCAGSQFDPRVVDAFCSCVRTLEAVPGGRPAR